MNTRDAARMIRAIHHAIEALERDGRGYWEKLIDELVAAVQPDRHTVCPQCGNTWPVGAVGKDGCPLCDWEEEDG